MLQLGLQEALVNAVRHGNGNDPAKLVRIRRIHSPQVVDLAGASRAWSQASTAFGLIAR